MRSSSIEVLIVGAGPVGLAMAALLRQNNIGVRIIEKNSSTTPYSKAIGVHSRTLESMHALGVTQKMVAQGQPMHDFALSENGQIIMDSSFIGIDSAYEFVLGLPQSRTEKILFDRYMELGGAIEWESTIVGIADYGDSHSLHAKAVAVIQKKDGSQETIRCNWLIGADGSRSSVRELAGIEFPGGSYGNAFILGDVKINWSGDKNKLQFFLSKRGYLLVIPMPNGMHRLIAQTDKKYEHFQSDDKPKATLEELQAIVDANGPGGIKIHSPQWLTCAPFYHRYAEKVLNGRVVLAGDSLHLFSPLGAQGLNTGFQDAFNLAWKIAFIEKKWADSSLLNTYVTERDEIARLIAQVTAKTTGYVTAISLRDRILRRIKARLWNNTSKVKRTLPKLMAGMLQKYSTKSPLITAINQTEILAGQRFPHFYMDQKGQSVPVASRVHGSQFTLVLISRAFDLNEEQTLRNIARHIQHIPYLKVLVVVRQAVDMPTDFGAQFEFAEDSLGHACRLASKHDRIGVLVRPDGFVCLSTQDWNVDIYLSYFFNNKIFNVGRTLIQAA